MSYFPFFREIEGEKCLVIGGGKVAARKISKENQAKANRN